MSIFERHKTLVEKQEFNQNANTVKGCIPKNTRPIPDTGLKPIRLLLNHAGAVPLQFYGRHSKLAA
jgi:hypothetical protein